MLSSPNFLYIVLLILKGSLRAFLTCLPGKLKAKCCWPQWSMGWGCFGSLCPCCWGGAQKSQDLGLGCNLHTEGPGLSAQTGDPHAEPRILAPCRSPVPLLTALKRRTRTCVSRRLSRPTPLSTTTTMGSLWRSMTPIRR